MFKGSKIGDINVDSWHVSRPNNLQEGICLLDFWSYTCSKCRKRIKRLNQIDEKFEEVEVVGVHTPEFNFEKKSENFRKALEDLELSYPVGHDSRAELRADFGGLSSQILLEDGRIVWKANTFSELERAFRQVLGKEVDVYHESPKEILLGYRNQGLNGKGFRGVEELKIPSSRRKGKLYGSGKWRQEESLVEAVEDSRVLFRASGNFEAVIHPGDSVRDVEVLVDGRKVSEEQAGKDLRLEDGRSYLRAERPDLYNVLELDREKEVTLIPEKNTRIYSVVSGEV